MTTDVAHPAPRSVARRGGRLLTDAAADTEPQHAAADAGWTARAACLKLDPDELFVRGAEQNRVKVHCRTCVVRMECLADALDSRVEFGVWGGMTERERRALLRRRPDVVSWRKLLEQARRDHLAQAG